MLKKSLLIVSLFILIVSLNVAFASESTINTDGLEKGFVTINVNTDNEVRVLVNKEESKATYTLTETENLSLQFGNGQYSVAVYEKINGRFKLVEETLVTLNLEDENQVYLNSIQNVKFDENSEAVLLAAELTEGLETELEKIEAIHTFIVENITYDYNKAKTVKGGYVPSNDSTLETLNGICYDYSSLMATMLRSSGIPTKLTVGYVGRTYHAWNEVYLSETNEWITVDSTTDAVYAQHGINYELAKTSEMYLVQINY
jgi:transglutaminase-like putative cysteine protease